jgi:hypothetical protein
VVPKDLKDLRVIKDQEEVKVLLELLDLKVKKVIKVLQEVVVSRVIVDHREVPEIQGLKDLWVIKDQPRIED